MSKSRPMEWMGQELDNYDEILNENDEVVDIVKHDSAGCDIHFDPETGEPRT